MKTLRHQTRTKFAARFVIFCAERLLYFEDGGGIISRSKTVRGTDI